MSALPRPSQLYDAVVVGSDLTGLVAAALLSKRGLRVLLVDGEESEKAEGGYLLPTSPNLLPAPRAIPSFHGILDQLGLMPTAGRSIVPYPSGLQLLRPDARLDLFPDDASRERELVRAFGPDAKGWNAGLEERELPITTWLEAAALLPPLGIKESFALRGPARKLARSQKAGDNPLLQALRALYEIQAPADGGEIGFSRTILPLFSQPSRMEGQSLSRALRTYISSRRGEVVPASSLVEEVVLEGGKFVGVRLQGFSAPHRGRVGLAACPPDRLVSLLEGRAQRKVEAQGAQIESTAKLFSKMLVLDEKAIPPGLGNLALAMGFGRREGVLLSIEPTLDKDRKRAQGLVTLTATSSFPLSEEEGRMSETLREVIEEFVPFHERHLRLATHAIGAPRVDVAKRGRLGVEGLPLETPVKRLLWASSFVLPGLGLEGRLLAGTRAADLAVEVAKKV